MNHLAVINPPPPMPIADIERVALAIAKGGLFGSKDPNAVLTLCLLAHAEGQHPAVVFRDYHIIQGKPAKKADAMLRDFINAGGSVKWHQLDDTKADATFSHPSGEARIDWTLDRAKKAGIANPMWSKYPRQMLRSRVISEGVRTVYPGATSGLYEENEVRDIVAETPREEAPAFIEDQPRPAPEAIEYAPAETTESDEKPQPAKGWREPESIYSTPTKLHAALITHQAELNRLGLEGTFDDLDGYLTAPEYQEFVKIAGNHAPHYLEGELPESCPPEFVQTFALEQKARDMIAIRGNIAGEVEPA